MKRLSLYFLSINVFTLVIIGSCKQNDSCVESNCNNGTYNEQTCGCDCATGYSGKNCESFDPAEVQTLLDSGNYTPIELVEGGVPIDSVYGNNYEGGTIFFLDLNDDLVGVNGMVAATEDQGIDTKWGCINNYLSGTKVGIGEGQSNTIRIVGACTESGIAAKICADLVLNGKDDWFLPSKEELHLMRTNLYRNDDGDFIPDWYWSSSEINGATVWRLKFFFNNAQDNWEKDKGLFVRAARYF